MHPYEPPAAVEIRVQLLGITPLIWRRLLVPLRFDLGQFHHIIQAAFGWTDSHLHEFHIGGLRYGDPEQFDDMASDDDARKFDETEVRLLDFRGRGQVTFTYLYDFGDDWEHGVTMERFLVVAPAPRTASCLAGERAGPPEDVGGVPGYQRFLEVMGDPTHEDHADTKRWAGRWFDPERFNLTKADRGVRAALRHPRREG